MKKLILLCCFSFVSSWILGCQENNETSIKNNETTNITPEKYVVMLDKGIDVDWWRKGTVEESRYNDKAIKDFYDSGIRNVRIRFQDYSMTEDNFEQLKHQVKLCVNQGIVPIIAYAANGFNNNPTDSERKKVVEWWSAMAEHLCNASDSLSFDIIIEPSDAIKKNDEQLNQCYEECVAAIRKSNPTRIIFIAPNHIANPSYLNDLKIPSRADGYLMIEWHFYAAGPSKTNASKLWTTGTNAEKKLVTQKIDSALTWLKANGLYSWVGAWMAGNYNKEDEYTVEEQQVFANFIRASLEKNKIPFSINADKHFYDYSTNTWKEEMIPLRNTIFE
nr:cellulase family glycosylhydrolase [Prevotella sp.]